jgi:hypothetical protein
MTTDTLLMEQCRNEADERYPEMTEAHANRREAYAAALYSERSKTQPDVARLVEAGDNLDHKFIDLVAFCAANIPENKLQELVDDWAGHEERAAWTRAKSTAPAPTKDAQKDKAERVFTESEVQVMMQGAQRCLTWREAFRVIKDRHGVDFGG